MGDAVFLKVAPLKGIMRFEKKGKLSPKFIEPFEILERVKKVVYRLALSPDLASVHNIFQVSMLTKYISDPYHILRQEPIEVYKDLTYEEKPIKIIDRQKKKAKK